MQKARTDNSNEICILLQKSISEISKQDYGNDDAIREEWLLNKTPQNVSDWISNANNISYVAIDKKNRILMGFILANKEYILLNYLLPEYMRKGIGTVLLNFVEKHFIENGVSEIRVDSTITAKNFYRKSGFLDNGEPRLVGNYQGEFPMIKFLNKNHSI